MKDLELVGELTIEMNVLRLTVAHLVADRAIQTADPDNWLRNFADRVHADIDMARQAYPSIAIMVEKARTSLDGLMRAARIRLEKGGR